MTITDFLIVYVSCLITMVLCRTVPVFALKGRTLSSNVVSALNLIPPVVFAALIANDLFKPDMFANGIWTGAMPLIASLLVFFVGYKTKSLVWCIIVGVTSYALMMLI